MKNHFSIKDFLSTKNLFVVISTIIFICYSYGCKEDNSILKFSNRGLTVEIKNSETHKYSTVAGDEEGVTIKVQAKHYDVSEIRRNSETNYVAV